MPPNLGPGGPSTVDADRVIARPEWWRFWRWSETNRIVGGFAAGALGGLVANLLLPDDPRLKWVLDQLVAPVGELFLRLIFMMIIPLIISAFILGVTGLRSMDRLRRIGGRYVLLVAGMATVMVGSSILVDRAIKPGRFVSEARRGALAVEYDAEAARDEAVAKEFPGLLPGLVSLVPDNPVLHLSRALTVHDDGRGLPAILIFSLFFSVAMLAGPADQMEVLERFFRGLIAVCMNVVSFTLKLAPLCIVFIAFDFAARLGLELMSSLSMYVVTYFAVCLVAFGALFPIVIWWLGKQSPLDFYRKIKEPFWFAVVTSSSSATYPIALRTSVEKLKLPESTVRFVLTLGTVANQSGASIYVAVSSLFLASIFGVHLTGSQQLELFALSVGFAFATPGVPGGILPLMATVCLLFGIPPRAVALLVSVDRLLDMGGTAVNVVGDLVVAAVLARAKEPVVGPDPAVAAG
jgi:DAACS family dicarboxylate/amino acid:cation (Na+ or H+) symporter